MASKIPEFEKMLANLEAEQKVIIDKSAPLREEREKLRVQITPAMDRIRALDKEIHATEQPQLAEINKRIVALRKALA